MAKTKAKATTRGTSKTSKTASTPKQTRESLKSLKDTSQKKYLKAENTTKKYSEYIVRGRKWLLDFEEGENNWGMNSVDDVEDRSSASADDFLRAFDDFPNEHSAKALTLFLTQKIFQENKGLATADGIYSAFKGLWKTSAGDKYRGKWHFNRDEKEWQGNPADSAEVQDVRTAIKNKCGAQGGDRKHSIAMSKEYMDKIFAWSLDEHRDGIDPLSNIKEEASHVKHVMFRAFMSLGWTIWTRNFELIKLQRKHLTLGLADIYGDSYFEVHLVDRKGWQKKIDKQQKEDDLMSNRYKIYSQLSTPSCDAKYWVLEWIQYLENSVYHRPLSPDDYLFPAISANGSVQTGEHITHDTVQKWITEFTFSAKIPIPAGGAFTTHCFRRGGAQYRFMFAPNGEKWSLKMIRWWGGWAEGEQTNTLIKYLLDELSAYENDYSDLLCPNRRRDEHSLLDEPKDIIPVTKQEVNVIVSTKINEGFEMVKDHLKDLFMTTPVAFPTFAPSRVSPSPSESLHRESSTPASSSTPTTHTRPIIPTGVTPHHPHPLHLFAPMENRIAMHSVCPPMSQNAEFRRPTRPPMAMQFAAPFPAALEPALPPSPSPSPPRTPAPTIPDVPVRLPDGRMSPKSNSWREIVEHWLRPDPARGLMVALKDWPVEWLRDYREQIATQYHYRKTIATEFIHQFNSNEAGFLAEYPEADLGHNALRKAIEKKRELRGERKKRGPRKKKSSNSSQAVI